MSPLTVDLNKRWISLCVARRVLPVHDTKDVSKCIGVLFVANKHGASAFSRMDRSVGMRVSSERGKLSVYEGQNGLMRLCCHYYV